MVSNFKLQSPKDSKRGFTLVEAFVAITILLIAVIGPLSLVARSLSNSIFAQNQITAYYLAQEGLELAINKVAENEIESREDTIDWLTGLEDCLEENGCTLVWDEEEGILADGCSNNGCEPMWQDTEGLFGYNDSDLSSTETIFTRTVRISDPNELDTAGADPFVVDALVTVTMNWTNRDRDQSFSVSTLIYNYFPESN